MPLTLHVGISRKLGLPKYGSVGANCAAQIELDPFIFHEPEALQDKIRAVFNVCRRAVDDELAQFQNRDPPSLRATSGDEYVEETAGCQTTPAPRAAPLATARQVEFLYYLTRQIRALNGQRLKLVVEHLYGRPMEELTAANASRLIELLKEVRSGARSADELLPEAAA